MLPTHNIKHPPTHTPIPDPSETIMNTSEARQYLRMSENSFYLAIRDGRIPGFRFGRQWRFRKSELDKAIANQEHTTHWRVS